MPLSVNVSTGLVKGRFGSGVVAGPNGEKLLVPARGRIDFVGMTPFSSFPLATPDPVTMLRPTGSGILDSDGYLCTPDPADKDKPGERMVLLQADNDPDSTVQGWTWRATLRFVNADGTRVHNTLDTITFDLPFGDVPFDLAHAVPVPESVGIGTEQAIILAASAQAHAASAADSAEAARQDAEVSAAAAVSAAAGAEGARANAESARVEADRAAGLVDAADSSAGAAASAANRAEREAEAANIAAGTASTAAGRSAGEATTARSAADTAVTASTEAASTANSAKEIATGVESRANAGEFKGAKGDTGPANKLTIGTVTKADAPAATITGTAPNQTLNLQLPKGDPGAKGDKGDVGPQGALRVSNTAGRAMYAWDSTAGREQLIYGDTGSRDISGMIDTTKWIVTIAKVRRVGWSVELRLVITPLSGVSGTVSAFASSLPIGFHNQHTFSGLVTDSGGNVIPFNLSYSGGPMSFSNVGGNRPITLTTSWQTDNIWPTTLPGVAASSAPNL